MTNHQVMDGQRSWRRALARFGILTVAVAAALVSVRAARQSPSIGETFAVSIRVEAGGGRDLQREDRIRGG